jgi:hypothetical protein
MPLDLHRRNIRHPQPRAYLRRVAVLETSAMSDARTPRQTASKRTVTRTNKGTALADSALDELTLTELVDLVLLDRGSDKTVMVDVAWTWSKRHDLADQLRSRVRRLTGQDPNPAEDRQASPRTTAQAEVPRRVADRLGEATVRQLIEDRRPARSCVNSLTGTGLARAV